MSAILRVALTGGIGSGKSTVSSAFQKLGAPIIDSDLISRDIVQPGSSCLNAIVDEFGSDILDKDETLDRDKLRDIIFNDAKKKKKLEKILHPVIYKKIENKLEKINYPYCLIVIPLLIETQATARFDRILLVDTTEELQIERTANRDKISIQVIKNIIQSQASRKQRLKYADDIIDNSLKIEELNEAVLKLHKKYRQQSSYNHKINE